MSIKKGKDYIVFPLDFSSSSEAKEYVKILSGKVGMFKIGLELFIDQGPSIINKVKELTKAGIFLDLKLHDISETVKKAMGRVAKMGVDLVTVHSCSSQKMLEMAVVGGNQKTGVLGVTLLTDNDSKAVMEAGFINKYVEDTSLLVMKRAKMAHAAGCRGVVCSGHEASAIKSCFGKDFLVVTPGIRPEWTKLKNDDQKRITTPAMAVQAGADLIVVGRPIRTAADPASAADRIAKEIDDALGQE